MQDGDNRKTWLVNTVIALLITAIATIWGLTSHTASNNTERINVIEKDVSAVQTRNNSNTEMLTEIRQDIKVLLRRND